jgi:AcrR family transcriptional regulator
MSRQRQSELKLVGRPRSFDEEKALDQAMHVFWEKGFKGASLSHLTKAMGIKAPSLYGAFGSKQELFRKALERYRVQQAAFIYDALQEPTAYEVAERILRESARLLTRPGYPRGCLTIQASLAASDECEVIHDELIKLRTDAQKALRRRFARAKQKGDLPEHSNPDSLARFITTVYQGMTIQSVNGATRKELLDLAQTSLRAWPVDARFAAEGLTRSAMEATS